MTAEAPPYVIHVDATCICHVCTILPSSVRYSVLQRTFFKNINNQTNSFFCRV